MGILFLSIGFSYLPLKTEYHIIKSAVFVFAILRAC